MTAKQKQALADRANKKISQARAWLETASVLADEAGDVYAMGRLDAVCAALDDCSWVEPDASGSRP